MDLAANIDTTGGPPPPLIKSCESGEEVSGSSQALKCIAYKSSSSVMSGNIMDKEEIASDKDCDNVTEDTGVCVDPCSSSRGVESTGEENNNNNDNINIGCMISNIDCIVNKLDEDESHTDVIKHHITEGLVATQQNTGNERTMEYSRKGNGGPQQEGMCDSSINTTPEDDTGDTRETNDQMHTNCTPAEAASSANEATSRQVVPAVETENELNGKSQFGTDPDWLCYAEVLYKCSLCAAFPAILTSRQHFRRHIQDVHLGSRGHECEGCELHFATEEDMRLHNKQQHVERPPSMGNSTSYQKPVMPADFHQGTLHMIGPNECFETDTPTGENHIHERIQNLLGATSVVVGEVNDQISQSLKDDADAPLCRSKRKRTYPQHVAKNQCFYGNNTSRMHPVGGDANQTTSDRQSTSNSPTCGVHLQQLDYSLLRSDRKRLLPCPQGILTNVAACEVDSAVDHSMKSEEESRPRATICYKPADGASGGRIAPAGHEHAQRCSSEREHAVSSGPLDLVLQHNSRNEGGRSSPSNKTKTPPVQASSPVNDSKRRRLAEVAGGTPTLAVPGQVAAFNLPLSAQYEAIYRWHLGLYGPPPSLPAQASAPTPSTDRPASSYPSLKEETESSSEQDRANPCCSHCKLEFASAEQFCQHYKEEHLPASGAGGLTGSAGDQQFKVLWIKQHLLAHITAVPATSGCVVLRDELLERLVAHGVDTADAATWGPACNRAVRECFPESQAHRKGKFKKTYFFGVRFIDTPCTVEEHKAAGGHEEEEDDDDEEEGDTEEEAGSPRPNGQDLEKLTAHLPCIIRWTGHMDNCISRDALLQTMSRRLDDNDVLSWGLQCNRAVRQLYPEVLIKRKGKYKTCYYGIEMISKGSRHAQLSTWSRSSSGPPVVNARDIVDTPGPLSMSRLPRVHSGPVDVSCESATAPNPLQAILNLLPFNCQRRSGPSPSVEGTTLRSGSSVVGAVNKLPSDLRASTGGRSCSPINHSRGSSPLSGHSDMTGTSVSPQMSPLALTTRPADRVDPAPVETTAENGASRERPMPPASSVCTASGSTHFSSTSPVRSPQPSGPVDALEKLILLHPGPFVAARVFCRRFQRLVPGVERVVYAMTMLQGRGLGQVFTLKHGNSKVFFKAVPSQSLEVPLTVLGVRLVDFHVMFNERDPRLEDTLHEKLKAFYPQPDLLASFYPY